MFLYWLPAERRYVHRQSDIPKGVEAERVDVPTDTAGLMAYLNGVVATESLPVIEAEIEELIPKPMTAVAVLSRMDSPGIDVEAVVETIGIAPMYALARYAGAVAVRYQELANSKK